MGTYEVIKSCGNCENEHLSFTNSPCTDCKMYSNWQPKDNTVKATDTQIGGNHYMAKVQPIDFIVGNDIPFREANIIKYVFRHKKKNGKQDLEKARHYLDMLIEEYTNA